MDLRPAEFLARYSHAEDRPPFRDYNGGVDIVLRDFRQQDFDTLWGIDQVCFVAGIAYSRRELGLYIRQPRSFTLVAESASGGQQSPVNAKTNATDSVIVGFLVAEAHRAAGHLITIDVLPQARRAGVGSKLLLAAEERLRSRSCRRIYLETAVDNLPAIAFYKRHQYFTVHTLPRYYSNGVDALMLEKDLLSAGQDD